MSETYIMTLTNNDIILNLGDLIYAKKDKNTLEVAFYEKNGIPGGGKIGFYKETMRDDRTVIDKFDVAPNKRKAYFVKNKKDDRVELEFLYQEDDIIEMNKKRRYKNLFYIKEDGRIRIIGFTGTNIEIPDIIDKTEVYAIGNMDENGNYIMLEADEDTEYEITMPDTVIEIFPNAFMNRKIKTINFSKNLYYIGERAFYGSSVEYINLYDTKIETIEKEAFYDSTIKSIIFPDTLKRIMSGAFKYSQVKFVEFNSDIECIEKESFYDCVIDTNKAKVKFVEENAFTYSVPSLDIECECINYDDIKYKIIGRLKCEDIIKDKILEKEGISENCRCLKQVFFAKDNEQKYEIVIEYDEEYGDNDEYLEFVKYVNSVRVNLYAVKNFSIDRHFESVVPEFTDVNLQGRIENGCIDIKKDDIGKITGIKLNDRYRYNYEDWIYSEFNSGEFNKHNAELARDILLNEEIIELEVSENVYKEYWETKQLYKEFLIEQ